MQKMILVFLTFLSLLTPSFQQPFSPASSQAVSSAFPAAGPAFPGASPKFARPFATARQFPGKFPTPPYFHKDTTQAVTEPQKASKLAPQKAAAKAAAAEAPQTPKSPHPPKFPFRPFQHKNATRFGPHPFFKTFAVQFSPFSFRAYPYPPICYKVWLYQVLSNPYLLRFYNFHCY